MRLLLNLSKRRRTSWPRREKLNKLSLARCRLEENKWRSRENSRKKRNKHTEKLKPKKGENANVKRLKRELQRKLKPRKNSRLRKRKKLLRLPSRQMVSPKNKRKTLSTNKELLHDQGPKA